MPVKTPKTRKSYMVNMSMAIMERVRQLSQNSGIPVGRISDHAFLQFLGEVARKEGITMMHEQDDKRTTKQVIAVANHKGGVGKTTTTAALAYLFATLGKKRVLLLDADAQTNLTQTMQAPMDNRIDIRSAVLSRCLKENEDGEEDNEDVSQIPIETFILPTQYDGIDMIPGNLNIEGNKFQRAVEKARLEEGANPWADVVEDIKAMEYYDLIMVDTHPSIGLDTLLPLQACDRVLVPMEPTNLAVSGLLQVFQNITKSRKANPNLHLLGCFFNRVKLNASSAKDYIPEARAAIPELIKHRNHGKEEGIVFKSVIRDSEDARKASNFHCAVTEKFRNKNISQDFTNLYKEIVEVLDHE